MAVFLRGNSANLNSLEFNLSTEKFLQSIQSQGFAVDQILDSSMSNNFQTEEAKVRFLKHPAKEIKNVFDKVEDGELVSAKPGKIKIVFEGKQSIQFLWKRLMNYLKMD
jgi:hypothetical protein